MSHISLKRPLKVCSTCRHWTMKYKGFCDHLQQGVGKFHICAGWTEESGGRKTAPPGETSSEARKGQG
jgi:hypothetical protein